jgi:regulatory subunit for Cdc7p protein kinase
MRESVIYFDSNDPSVLDGGKRKEKEQAIKMFTQVGASIQQFFDHTVTVVVSNRDKSELPPKMFAYSTALKFWKYEKVFRFLKHLGEVPSPEQSSKSKQHLSSLLQDEKLHGTLDRDPLAKRDDFNYFKHPYFYVYDVRQVIKPVSLREWKTKEEKRPWPHLNSSTYGHSLFTPDPANTHDPKKKERRRLRDEQNKRHRDRLKAIYSKNLMFTSSSENSPNKHDYYSPENKMPPPFAAGRVPLLSRQASFINNKFIESNKRDGFEIEASGYTGSTNVSGQSAEFTRNGLVAPKSTVPSKQINHLQRKLIEKRSKLSNVATKDTASNQKAKVPGYCENCRIHFNDFDEHCESQGHKSFAENDENFECIDELIDLLRDSIKNKR